MKQVRVILLLFFLIDSLLQNLVQQVTIQIVTYFINKAMILQKTVQLPTLRFCSNILAKSRERQLLLLECVTDKTQLVLNIQSTHLKHMSQIVQLQNLFTLFILVISSDSAQQNESSFTNLGCSSLHTAFEKKGEWTKFLLLIIFSSFSRH